MHWHFFKQATGKQWCLRILQFNEEPPVNRICEYIKLSFWPTKESRKKYLSDYLPPTCPSLILCRPKYTHSSHMLKQQGPQISVQQKNQKAKLQVYSLLFLLLTDLSVCPRPPPTLTPWLHLLSTLHSSGHSQCLLVTALTAAKSSRAHSFLHYLSFQNPSIFLSKQLYFFLPG